MSRLQLYRPCDRKKHWPMEGHLLLISWGAQPESSSVILFLSSEVYVFLNEMHASNQRRELARCLG